jgi:uncharacterized protein (DUF58 family)
MKLRAAARERFYRWALRGRAPEPVPIVLNQRRIFVLPTGQGIAFAGMLTLMLAAAMNYSLSLGYALVFSLAGVGTVTILHTFRNLAQLTLQPGRCPPVFVGETAHFGLILHNTRAQPRPGIHLRLPEQTVSEIDLPALSHVETPLALPATKRGWLALPRVTLWTTYPLGLIRAWSYAAPDLRCLIYPAPASEALPLPSQPATAGHQAIQRSGDEDFAGLRRHQPADPPQHIAWKAAARQEAAPLQTKQFSSTAAQTLWLDWDQLPAGLDVERRLSILARWICDAQTAGHAFGLRLPGVELSPATGEAHYHAALKHLALYGTATD